MFCIYISRIRRIATPHMYPKARIHESSSLCPPLNPIIPERHIVYHMFVVSGPTLTKHVKDLFSPPKALSPGCRNLAKEHLGTYITGYIGPKGSM